MAPRTLWLSFSILSAILTKAYLYSKSPRKQAGPDEPYIETFRHFENRDFKGSDDIPEQIAEGEERSRRKSRKRSKDCACKHRSRPSPGFIDRLLKVAGRGN